MALDIYADVIQNPTFPAAEFESPSRQADHRASPAKGKTPNAISNTVYNKVLYGTHPYGRAANTEATLKAITRDDPVQYYESTFRPNNGALVVSRRL